MLFADGDLCVQEWLTLAGNKTAVPFNQELHAALFIYLFTLSFSDLCMMNTAPSLVLRVRMLITGPVVSSVNEES